MDFVKKGGTYNEPDHKYQDKKKEDEEESNDNNHKTKGEKMAEKFGGESLQTSDQKSGGGSSKTKVGKQTSIVTGEESIDYGKEDIVALKLSLV